MLERICIGVDGSACARRAAVVGLAIAEAAPADVDLVHVESDDAQSDRETDPALEDALESLGETEVAVDRHVLTGSPAEQIVAFADDADADLLVLGRLGRAGVGERLLGSVVHSVFRRTDRPVLTVPEGDGETEFSDLLVPTDGSEQAANAVPLATALARQHGAGLHAVYALDLATAVGPFSAGGVTDAQIAELEAECQEELDVFTDRIGDDPDMSIRSAVVRDAPHEAIGNYVAEHGVDLVVMSSRGETSALGQMLGSTTDRVLRTVDVPVLVITAEEGPAEEE